MSRLPYPDYENASGWNRLLPPRTDVLTLTADNRADVVVIGAGFTGIAAARRWSQHRPDDYVVVIDSSEVGEGNPGRNSGFLLEIALANDADASQMDRMAACNRLISDAMKRLRDAVFDGGIDCAIERSGTFRAAAGRSGAGALERYRDFLEAARLPHERLDRAELEARIGTAFYRAGLFSPHCYLVQPAALIRGLAGLLPPGVGLFENTPALCLLRDGNEWRIETPQATLSAPTVIVANNAFAKELGVAPSRVVAMYTYAGLTEPVAEDVLATLGVEQSWGLLPAHRLGCTLRRTRDGRMLIRARYGYEREGDNRVIGEKLHKSLRARFPQLEDVGFESVWGGATGFTLNGAPVWGEAQPGLFVSAGCNGGGVVKGTLFGELLVEQALGRPVPNVGALFGAARWMPPEPLRRLGFVIASLVEQRGARAEM